MLDELREVGQFVAGAAALMTLAADTPDRDAGRPDVDAAVRAAVDWLRDHQAAEGWWKGELETNVTMDAEDLLLREFLGIRDEQVTDETARWIRSKQRADGTWATFPAARASCRRPSRRGSRFGWPATIRQRRTWRGRPHWSESRAASSGRGCSPASGWRCSGCGRGTSCPTFRRR